MLKIYATSALFFVLSLVLLSGQTPSQDWENPTVFEINKRPPHAYFIPYQNQEAALQADVKTSDRYQLLNGIWNFKFYSNPLSPFCKETSAS